MMGERRADQGALFYEFSFERHVPADHLLSAIDRFVTSPIYGFGWRHSIARWVGLRSIPSC